MLLKMKSQCKRSIELRYVMPLQAPSNLKGSSQNAWTFDVDLMLISSSCLLNIQLAIPSTSIQVSTQKSQFFHLASIKHIKHMKMKFAKLCLVGVDSML